MSKSLVTAWVLLVVFAFPVGGAAENVAPKEPQKEPEQAPSTELKKKSEPKPDARPAEEKSPTEPPAQELKKKGEPDRKPDLKSTAPEKQANEPPAEPKKKTEPEAKPAPGEKQPEAQAPAPPKKKTEADRKPDSKSAQEEKPAAEPPQAPPSKAEEPAKKPVASLNLTIKLALMAEPTLFPLEVEVAVDKQTVTLTGAVPTEEDKVKAGQIATAIEGVDSLVNKLTVDAAVRNAWIKKQDEAITQLVKERFNRSETLKAVGFEVKSEQGVVSLSGKTHYQVIALEAAEAARHVPGVRAVNSAGVQLTGKD